MALVQDDHVVQALAADAPDQPFHVGILPWALRGDHNFCDPHVSHPLPKRGAVDPVPVAEEIPRGLIPREGVHHLLRGPLCGGMFCDIDMDDTAPFMGQDDQDKEHRTNRVTILLTPVRM